MMLPATGSALAALFVECETADPERFTEAMGPSGGHVETAINVLAVIVAVAIWATGTLSA